VTHIEIGDPAQLDAALQPVPNTPAVFLLWPERGDPYLARTALLRRRLLRLLGAREKPGRLLNLRDTVRRIEYHLTASSLESSIWMYELARKHFAERYLDVLKLRMPPYVKIVASNPFPRSTVTTHLGRGANLYFGPFQSRATAEGFEAGMLDLFQMRRCQEDLTPSPEHPGCIYGEMSMCLRPCQEVVGMDEYRHEAGRVMEFLSSGGRSLVESIAKARDRLSEEMEFEAAARQHKRLEKVQEVVRLSDELARETGRLQGVAVTRAVESETVILWFVREGYCLPPAPFNLAVPEGRMVSLDQRLREAIARLELRRTSARERQERLALLARWFYSSWRDGEWIPFEGYENIPYRRLVHGISRIAHGAPPAL